MTYVTGTIAVLLSAIATRRLLDKKESHRMSLPVVFPPVEIAGRQFAE